MVKKFYYLVVSIFFVTLFLSPTYSKDFKLGYADVMLIFNEYNKTKEYQKVLEEKRKESEEESNLQEKKEDIIKMQDSLALLKTKMSTLLLLQIDTIWLSIMLSMLSILRKLDSKLVRVA